MIDFNFDFDIEAFMANGSNGEKGGARSINPRSSAAGARKPKKTPNKNGDGWSSILI